MNHSELWKIFKNKYDIKVDTYEAWAFGGAPDQLADLVIKGIKVGTASAYPLYELELEPLPQEGSYSVILNSKDEAVCIIQTTKVYIVPFKDVTAEHAFKEGEGDKSLAYWREVHKEFFEECLRDTPVSFSEDMGVVCEEFKLVYVLEDEQ